MKTNKMKRTLGMAWLCIPCLLLSAFLHVIDPDVQGLQNLFSIDVVLSVIIWGLPFLAVTCLSSVALKNRGTVGLAAVAFPASVGFGFLLAVFGSSAATVLGFAWSIVGAALFIFAILMVATLPTKWFF